ncbi:MAG: hypothetical protein RLZZ50_616, partial [Verrucomicrobiota bacterium]
MKSTALSRLAFAASVLLGLSACGKKAPAPDDGSGAPAVTKITVQLDWFPEPEHGGLFQAQAKGWFREAGLDVTLVPGGPNALVNQRVGTGQAQIGQ